MDKIRAVHKLVVCGEDPNIPFLLVKSHWFRVHGIPLKVLPSSQTWFAGKYPI
jgi:hypothetical protein